MRKRGQVSGQDGAVVKRRHDAESFRAPNRALDRLMCHPYHSPNRVKGRRLAVGKQHSRPLHPVGPAPSANAQSGPTPQYSHPKTPTQPPDGEPTRSNRLVPRILTAMGGSKESMYYSFSVSTRRGKNARLGVKDARLGVKDARLGVKDAARLVQRRLIDNSVGADHVPAKRFEGLIYMEISDDMWFELQFHADEASEKYGIPLPLLPSDDVQMSFTAHCGRQNLKQAFEFYRYVLSVCNISKARETRIMDFGSGWGRISRIFLREV